MDEIQKIIEAAKAEARAMGFDSVKEALASLEGKTRDEGDGQKWMGKQF